MEIKNTARTVLKKAIIFSLLFAGVTCAYSQILDKNALLKKKAELSEQIKQIFHAARVFLVDRAPQPMRIITEET